MLTNIYFKTAKSKLIRYITVCFEDVGSSWMICLVIGNYFYALI